MTKETKEYQGIERKQAFVKRFALNPGYTGETVTLPGGFKMDHRRWNVTPEWTYCVKRHREFWAAQGDRRRTVPPNIRNDDAIEGWWFPESWIIDYAERFRRAAA